MTMTFVHRFLKRLHRLTHPKSYLVDNTIVAPKGRDEIVYREGSRLAVLYSELQTGAVERLIYPDSLKYWEPASAKVLITDDDKQQIINSVKVYYDRLGVTYKVEE